MSAVLDHASQLERLLLDHNVTIFGYERAGEFEQFADAEALLADKAGPST